MRPLSAWILALAAVSANAQVTAVRAGRLLDPETGQVANSQTILVERGRIKAVGASLEIPAGAKVIDLSDRLVMPGLFDCHTHMAMRTDRGRFASNSLFMYDVEVPTASRALDGVANCREMLEAGFTTIRDVGNSGKYIDVALKLAIEQGHFPGPTMICAGRIIAPFGGQYHLNPERPELIAPEYFPADTRDELLKAIRENIHYGADVIKIVIDDQRYIYSTEDIKFIVDEAGKAGLKVCAHSLTEQGSRNAAEAGVASIEHGFNLSDEVLALCKKNGVALVSTDLTPRVWTEYGLPEDVGNRIHRGLIERLKRVRAAGVTVAFGSDLIFSIPEMTRGQWSLTLLDGFVKAGYTNAEILQILVPNSARLLGVERQRGWIKAGMAADLIAMPESPLDKIEALKGIDFVMKDGAVIKGK